MADESVDTGTTDTGTTESTASVDTGLPPNPAPVAAAPTESAPTETAPATTNWRDTVTDTDLRKIADRFNTPADMAKAVLDLRKRESTSIRMPGKDAKPEEVSAFYKALGVPEGPDGYQFKTPDGVEITDQDKAFQSEMAKIMHTSGIPKAAAERLVDGYNAFAQNMMKAAVEADTKFADQATATLKQEWGDDYNRNLAFAAKAAQELFGDTYDAVKQMEGKNGRFILDNPVFIKAFAKIGGEMAEGTIGPRLDASEMATMDQRVSELGRQKFEAMERGDRATATRLDAEQRDLINRMGSGNIVGQGGRVA